jgi:dTDP-4-amino-4,6-dideoxygalactose transaminase
MNNIRKIFGIFSQWFRSPFFGFVQGHGHLTAEDLRGIRALIDQPARRVVADFEAGFASLVGPGQAISYAAGRMGFFDLMRVLGIGAGDEVILLGATCAVMVNAVLRAGATPIFSDIDPNTFGSTADTIQKCISLRTRMIVAQHSFGIPCDIEPIVNLALSRKIFLLEDCALALGSRLGGVAVGNFGDAALFSTDHSKPLNSLIGGLVYTRDAGLAERLRKSQAAQPELPMVIQRALWHRLLIERRYCTPERYGRLGVIDLIAAIKYRLLRSVGPFLSDDFGITSGRYYPYPARLPGFLAALGLLEIKRWPQVSAERKALLRSLLDVASNSCISSRLPKAYMNKCLDIVPLRFVWTQPDGALVRETLGQFIQISWIWFMQPIIATRTSLRDFGYLAGSCPISEQTGPGMVNLPCNVAPDKSIEMVRLLKEFLK